MAKKRDYRAEYLAYQGTPEQRKRNDARKAARRKMVAAGKVKPGDNRDIDHRNGNPKDNRMSNLTSKSKSKNRSYPRTKNAGKKNKTD